MPQPADRIQPVSPGLLWFSRIMAWLCWAGIAWTLIFAGLMVFNVFPINPGARDGALGYASVSFGVHDPTAPRPPVPTELLRDPLYIAASLVPTLLTIWALLCAHTTFANIGRGQFFARSTSLNLRNLSLAVLLNMTLAPIVDLAATVAFAMRMKDKGLHGELYFDFGISSTTLLILIFAGTVAIIATVMARAARLADENEQFV